MRSPHVPMKAMWLYFSLGALIGLTSALAAVAYNACCLVSPVNDLHARVASLMLDILWPTFHFMSPVVDDPSNEYQRWLGAVGTNGLLYGCLAAAIGVWRREKRQ